MISVEKKKKRMRYRKWDTKKTVTCLSCFKTDRALTIVKYLNELTKRYAWPNTTAGIVSKAHDQNPKKLSITEKK